MDLRHAQAVFLRCAREDASADGSCNIGAIVPSPCCVERSTRVVWRGVYISPPDLVSHRHCTFKDTLDGVCFHQVALYGEERKEGLPRPGARVIRSFANQSALKAWIWDLNHGLRFRIRAG